jgi:hypothetical protein
MRRFSLVLALVGLTSALVAGPATAQATGVLDRAASSLRSDPVYVDAAAERAGDVDAAAQENLRRRVRDSGSAIFLAVLPASAADESDGDATRVAQELASRTGLAGTYGVVVGNSFRGGPSAQVRSLATAAFQAHSADGTAAVLADFVDRVADLQPAGGQTPGQGPLGDDGGASEDGGGGSNVVPLVLLAGAAGGGYWFWRRKQSRDRAEEKRNHSVVEGQLAVLADDVVSLDPQVTVHPDARPDYDAAVTRYRVAQAALESVDGPVDLVRVSRLLDEAQYAMSRARAIVEGREPPPPPSDLTRPGRRGEPPVDLDEQGQPAYVGSGSSPFYGGGWFGGGGGLLTGLFLGQMLGGGWGGGWGGHDTNVYVDNSGDGGDGGDGGGDVGGGDWGGGGGDMGGGDWGGGDWGGGGGDMGGGDWGG